MKKTNKKNIVLVSRGLGFGGSQKILVFLSNLFATKNRNVTIISLSSARSTLTINESIKVIYLGYEDREVLKLKFLARMARQFKLIYRLRAIIKKLRPDLVICFMPDIMRIFQLSSIGIKIRKIGSERGGPFQRSRKQLKKHKITYEKCDVVVFQTDAVASFFNLRTKYSIIPNPYLPRKDHIIPYEGERRKIVLGVGRLGKEKCFDKLILAFNNVFAKHPDYLLFIIGEGEERNNLESLIFKLSLQQHVFLKGKSDNVFLEYKDVSMYVLSSNTEGIPNTLLEALGAGIPCIATDCPSNGPRQLLDGGNRGILVEIDNIDCLAEAMCTLIEKPLLSSQFGKLGLGVKEQYRSDTIEAEWNFIVDQIFNKSEE